MNLVTQTISQSQLYKEGPRMQPSSRPRTPHCCDYAPTIPSTWKALPTLLHMVNTHLSYEITLESLLLDEASITNSQAQ